MASGTNRTTVGVHEAKTQLSRLLERVRGGEEIVIAKNGVPVARLCPIGPAPRRVPGILSGKIDDRFFEPLPEEELEGWER
jgi:prevent-host-death family protein